MNTTSHLDDENFTIDERIGGLVQNTQTLPLHSTLLADDPEMLDLVHDFVQGLDRRISDMLEARNSSDWSRLRSLAHQLKGAGGSYGYPDLSDLAARLEVVALATQPPVADHLLSEIGALIHSAKAALPAFDHRNSPQ